MLKCPVELISNIIDGDTENGLMEWNGLRIIYSNRADWEHVSVSRKNKIPTFDEMQMVKRTFWDEEDVVMQLHVAEKDHINVHPYCLHLWRPLKERIPTPPKWMVA